MSRYEEDCRHETEIRYTHGRNAPAKHDCKLCGKVVSRNELRKKNQRSKPRERKVSRRKK